MFTYGSCGRTSLWEEIERKKIPDNRLRQRERKKSEPDEDGELSCENLPDGKTPMMMMTVSA